MGANVEDLISNSYWKRDFQHDSKNIFLHNKICIFWNQIRQTWKLRFSIGLHFMDLVQNCLVMVVCPM